VKGEGGPLLLIHGYGAGFWVWEKQIDILCRSHRVYALDLIGHGFSDRPKIEYKPETYIHFLRDFMDEIGVERATLIGNSMGGGIAWAVAALFPERVKKLILIDCVPPDVLSEVRNESFKALAAIKDIPLLPYLAIGSRHKNSVRKVLHECVVDTGLITPEVLDRQYELMRIRGTTWVLYSTLRNAKDTSAMKDYLPRIHHSTLLIWGAKDLIFPPYVGENLHQAIRGSKLMIIEKSGHIPMWETPDEVNQAIQNFLKEAT
jgi:pimeloyl-ACP methyl ester carboxylesterase